MKRRQQTITWMVLLALLMSVGGTVAQDPGPRGEVSIEATVNPRISYQGVLKENGSPVTGSRDMTFRLYSDDACTTQVGSDIAKAGVQVADGLFSVALDVTHADVDGQGLWLEVEVGGAAIVCQEILPVPYALSLRPGASIVGQQAGSAILTIENSSSANDSRAIRGYASAGGGFTAGVNGRTDSSSTGAKGVWGYAAGGGQTYGVHGESNSTSGRGVYGRANATSGTTYGVYGETRSTSGRGVYGIAATTSGETYGVYGQTDSSFKRATGVYGHASAASGRTYGVRGQSASTSGWGVFGHASATSGETSGVYGRSDSLSGYGVYGNNTAGGYAGYFDGDVAQSRTGNGLVKAGAYAQCGQSTNVERWFNNVGDSITISSSGVGLCTIDFGFPVGDRFWIVQPVVFGAAPRGINCWASLDGDQLECYRFDLQGAATNGYMMVLVY